MGKDLKAIRKAPQTIHECYFLSGIGVSPNARMSRQKRVRDKSYVAEGTHLISIMAYLMS
ncbi:hypothetical protein X727_12510 [Mesorhizobium sp. L103C119B0]|nr:hypothetical protein X727_12510 [Mesorhizobium sp. L103C119B0]